MRLFEVELSFPDNNPGTWLYRWNVAAESVEHAAAKATQRAGLLHAGRMIEVRKVEYKGALV